MRRPAPPTPLAIACCIGTLLACQEEDHHWSYEGDSGPDHWASLDSTYAPCGSGMRQSPIDLAGATPSAGSALAIEWRPADVRVLDTGHAIQVDVDDGGAIVLEGRRFALAQFHVHLPSEHTVDGTASPMEIHFVHLAEAGDGDLAVIGVLAHVGEAHPDVEHIRNAMPDPGGDPAALAGFDPRALLPEGGDHFRYDGSLTTPPCSEVVSWVVMTEAISVSREQLDAFAARYSMNARPVLPLNGRSIQLRR